MLGLCNNIGSTNLDEICEIDNDAIWSEASGALVSVSSVAQVALMSCFCSFVCEAQL